MPPLNQIVLTPLAARPPLPPRPNESPRDLKSMSSSERDSVGEFCFIYLFKRMFHLPFQKNVFLDSYVFVPNEVYSPIS